VYLTNLLEYITKYRSGDNPGGTLTGPPGTLKPQGTVTGGQPGAGDQSTAGGNQAVTSPVKMGAE